MPRPEISNLTQRAVLFPNIGKNIYGNNEFGELVQICVRWEGPVLQQINPELNSNESDFSIAVDRDIEIGSLLWMGELIDWYGSGSSLPQDELMEVVRFLKTPDTKGRVYRRVCGVNRYRSYHE